MVAREKITHVSFCFFTLNGSVRVSKPICLQSYGKHFKMSQFVEKQQINKVGIKVVLTGFSQ